MEGGGVGGEDDELWRWLAVSLEDGGVMEDVDVGWTE